VQGAGFLEGERTISVTEAEFKRRDDRAKMDTCTSTHQFYIDHIFNTLHCWSRMARRLAQGMVRLEGADQSKGTHECDLVSTEASDQ
jgi:hypothetical protein